MCKCLVRCSLIPTDFNDSIVGSSAKKPAEFITAVHVAQEMAVLSPSLQDRPLLPTCHVLLGELPDDVKSVFRKWTPSRSPVQQQTILAPAEEVMQELGIAL